MNNDATLQELWQDVLRDERISVEQAPLIASLRKKAKRLNRMTRLSDLSEFSGLLALLLVIAFLVISDPSLLKAVPIRVIIAFGTIISASLFYLLTSYRAKRVPLPEVPTLLQVLLYEKEMLARRIRVLSNLIWIILGALSGPLLLILLSPLSLPLKVLSTLGVAGLTTIAHMLIKREVQKTYEPLHREIDKKLHQLL